MMCDPEYIYRKDGNGYKLVMFVAASKRVQGWEIWKDIWRGKVGYETLLS